MSTFKPRSVELRGGFRIERPVGEVFPLFSPLGEKRWVPGWSPELLHPPGTSWARGLIFRTMDVHGEVVWVVTELDPVAHRVEYHRVEPGHYVARVNVACAAAGDAATDVRVSYAYVGLSDDGNAELAAMGAAAYDEKMRGWKRLIDTCLAGASA